MKQLLLKKNMKKIQKKLTHTKTHYYTIGIITNIIIIKN